MPELSKAVVRWAPRIPKRKLRRLYESDAKGLLDEGLLNDVGISLLLRCESILTVARARRGEVKCPQCAEADNETWIERSRGNGDPRDQALACPRCGWRITWGEYARSFKRAQLNAGGAVEAFESYARDYPAARTPQMRFVAVDRLIHAFHYSLRSRPGLPTRPAGVNLIEGKLGDVIQFLDELTYGESSAPESVQTRAAWQAEMARYHTEFLAAYARQADDAGEGEDGE
jgi:hypothetical protein